MPNDPLNDTIVALATGHISGALATVRISGQKTRDILQKLLRVKQPQAKGWAPLSDPIPRYAYHTQVHIPENPNTEESDSPQNEPPQGYILDDPITIFYAGPASYTGEDAAEITCHASPYIIDRLTLAVCQCGARTANPGEFTQRAFINGKVTLQQAEAIPAIIAAITPRQHRIATTQKDAIPKTIEPIRERIVHLTALLELELDFSDQDVTFTDRKELKKEFLTLRETLARMADSYVSGQLIVNGIRCTIAGPPNAGKSTLLNRIANEQKAIVTDIPGTTRDIITHGAQIDGNLVLFSDTAGIRHSDDPVESIGIERAWLAIKKANIVILMAECDTHEDDLQELIRETETHTQGDNTPIILLRSKADLSGLNQTSNPEATRISERLISLHYSDRIDATHELLIKTLSETIATLVPSENEQALLTNPRHYSAIQQALEHLDELTDDLTRTPPMPTEILAFHMRNLIEDLENLTGHIHNDEILQDIFANFCIGK